MTAGVSALLRAAFSPALISVGQTLAMTAFLLRGDEAVRRHPGRLGLMPLLFLGGTVSQMGLRMTIDRSLPVPMLPFILATVLLYQAYVCLFTRRPWEVCMFVSLIFLMVDNSVWPLISSLSRMLLGVNYLYEGDYALRLPAILLLWVLEYGLLRLLLRFLPPLGRIRMTGYTLTMTIAAVIPFLCIRSLSSAMQLLENKSFQILTASCFLVELVTLARGIGVETGERERLRALELRRVLDTQQQQFHLKMQHIDDVNRKYHDMKNILLVLESGAATDDMRAGVRRLIGDIRPYETLVETGNGALDIVLSDKLRVCQQEEIRCVPYVDGRMLDFVDPLDLCTIFGNALDNAIESCRQQENPENRQISIRTVSRGTAVVLVFRNTFAMRPVLRDGLPVSTKADRANHGYGLRNICYVVGRYGGEMSCRVSGEEFVLTLLLLRGQDD